MNTYLGFLIKNMQKNYLIVQKIHFCFKTRKYLYYLIFVGKCFD